MAAPRTLRDEHPFEMPSTKRIVLMLVLYLIGFNPSQAQSLAHERSAYAIIDPAYSSRSVNPPTNLKEDGAPWIYGAGELESWRLRLLMARKDSAELRVGYPGVYHTPYTHASYRLFLAEPVDAASIRGRAVGRGEALLNGVPVAAFDASEAPFTVHASDVGSIREIQFNMSSATGPPALLIEDGAFSTANKNWLGVPLRLSESGDPGRRALL